MIILARYVYLLVELSPLLSHAVDDGEQPVEALRAVGAMSFTATTGMLNAFL